MLMGLIYAGIVALIFAILERPICKIFTSDEIVLTELSSVWIAFILFCILD